MRRCEALRSHHKIFLKRRNLQKEMDVRYGPDQAPLAFRPLPGRIHLPVDCVLALGRREASFD